jgi:hypothetical protein
MFRSTARRSEPNLFWRNLIDSWKVANHIDCWMHVRRYYFEAKESDPGRAHEALARIRLLYAVEADAKTHGLNGSDLAADRREQAGPVRDWPAFRQVLNLVSGHFSNIGATWNAKEIRKMRPFRIAATLY